MKATYEDTVAAAVGSCGGAVIASVLPDSPADDAGFCAGCCILNVNGAPLRDILDWQWLSDGVAITVDYIDTDGDEGSILLERDSCEPWGFQFAERIFDGVRLCKNRCTFCFMAQLPRNMRKSLYLRDDDYRMSFLDGTFVTLTNVNQSDIDRIIEQHLSPLRLSFHAYSSDIREGLIGRHQAVGVAAFEELAHAGIHFDIQIVLVPDANDGEELNRTLDYLFQFKEVDGVGIVPLGYTSHQTRFDHSCTDAVSARRVINQISIFQKQAEAAGRGTWVWAADEFYLGAAAENLAGMPVEDVVPPAPHYGSFEMYEDGIGMIRTTIDEWASAEALKACKRSAAALDASDTMVLWVCGEAIAPVFEKLLVDTPLQRRVRVLPVHNEYFGGNVNVTGLLCGCDIAQTVFEAVTAHGSCTKWLAIVPDVVFNADGVTLDDMNAAQIEAACGCKLRVVSCQTCEMLDELSVSTRS